MRDPADRSKYDDDDGTCGITAENALREVLNELGIDYTERDRRGGLLRPQARRERIRPPYGKEVHPRPPCQLDYACPPSASGLYLHRRQRREEDCPCVHPPRDLSARYERSLAYLIEETMRRAARRGWLPSRCSFLPVTDRADRLLRRAVAKQLEEQGFRVEVDYRNEKIGRKIRDAQTEKVPYMVIVGDRDMENGTVSPRHRADGDLGAMSVDEFSALLKRVVDNKEQK
ncbi:MAG: His/Gly/Thr/Pro-type tRNA ligase C-terminal domain-containing protein [Oscillospiraceae bacterium]